MTDHARTITLLEFGVERLKKGWTQEEMAMNKAGKPVSPTEPEAVCWCALGCIQEPGNQLVRLDAQLALSDTFQAEGYSAPNTMEPFHFIAWVNDLEAMYSWRMIELFRKTIDRLRAKTPVPSGA